jgi:hypothetical protein
MVGRAPKFHPLFVTSSCENAVQKNMTEKNSKKYFFIWLGLIKFQKIAGENQQKYKNVLVKHFFSFSKLI